MFAPHESEKAENDLKYHVIAVFFVSPISGDVAVIYLSLKNRISCCNSVTASKDKSGSHLPGVLGGGFFDNSEAKFGLTPADNKCAPID